MKDNRYVYAQKPRRKSLWIIWVLLGLLLVMAVGLYAMIYMEGQMPAPVVSAAVSTVSPVPTATLVPVSPTPEAVMDFQSVMESEIVEESSLEEASSVEEAVPEEDSEETLPEEPAAVSPDLNEESEPLEVAEDPLWYLRLVNRWNPIPEEYEMELVEVPGGQLVDARIYEPLMALLQAAEAENLGPIVVAGYRTWEKQQSIMDERIAGYMNQGYSEEEAAALAEQWVSVPGHSEHQLGLAVDINGAVSAIYPWLREHSWEYGFIQRYPKDKSEITGCSEEEWHFRYVGVEAAAEIYESGLCLEEYLGAA